MDIYGSVGNKDGYFENTYLDETLNRFVWVWKHIEKVIFHLYLIFKIKIILISLF